MTLSRSNPRAKQRWGLLVAIIVTFTLIGGAASVLAVHQLDFELDADTDTDAVTPPPFDWEDFFDSAGNELSLPSTDFTDSGFEKDFLRTTSGAYDHEDGSTYATGSKDTLSISPGWQCNKDNHVNSKIDITNAYAASYLAPADIPDKGIEAGDEILYFALERFANEGDANVGFWFIQDEVTCESTGGSVPFSGGHQDGDVLVVSAFTKGGDVSTITAYRWVGDDDTGGIDPTPIATGVDCRDPIATPANDTTCAVVNHDTIDPAWDNANKSGGSDVEVGEFFEGGLNITEAGLGGQCFSTFIADTRSSQSLTATLFDFARGQLGECEVEVTTSPSTTSIQLGAGSVTDTATVTGTGGFGGPPVPTGTVAFFICEPDELDTNEECSTGGTQVGTPVEGEDLAPTGNPSQASATSEAFTPTVIGKHCWRAEYSGDGEYDATVDFDGATECFTVTGVASLSTAQNWLPNDSATISGPTDLSGTATFTLYDDATCGTSLGSVVYGPEAVSVSGTSPQTVSTSNTSTVVVDATEGDYSWLVSYADAVLGAPTDACETTTITITD